MSLAQKTFNLLTKNTMKIIKINLNKCIVPAMLLMVGVLSPLSTFAMGHGNRGEMGNDQWKSMGGNGQEQSLNIAQLPKEELSEAEKQGLVYMLEEEKLARDVYKKLGEKYNINVFKNIPNSEQRHIDAVRELAGKYDLEYQTVNDNNIGIFKNKKIQELYNELITKGEKSLVDALEVGATIEDVDIYDLQEFLKDVDNQDIKKVYEYLIMGSENHLRAFNKQLIKNGEEPYKAQYITQAEVDKILAGTNSHGNGQQNKGEGMQNAIKETPEQTFQKLEEKEIGFFGTIWRWMTSWF